MGIHMKNSVNYTGGGMGVGATKLELTLAEYEALTPEEKNNGTMYFLTDVNGDGEQFQPIIYSEDEREVGVWIDGKPLYQKTINLTYDNFSSYSYIRYKDLSLGTTSVIDKLIYVYGYVITKTYGLINIPLGYSGWDNATVFGCYTHTSSTDYFLTLMYNVNNYSSEDGTIPAVVTIQYTKTTDRPGSGQWTPQGVPTVHYDNNEKIVGTYFGETLYEKTLLYQKVDISSGSQNINHGITSFGKLVSLDAVWIYSNGDCNFATAVNVGDSNYLMKIWDFGISDFTLHIGSSAYSIFDHATFTIRYTKTSSSS